MNDRKRLTRRRRDGWRKERRNDEWSGREECGGRAERRQRHAEGRQRSGANRQCQCAVQCAWCISLSNQLVGVSACMRIPVSAVRIDRPVVGRAVPRTAQRRPLPAARPPPCAAYAGPSSHMPVTATADRTSSPRVVVAGGARQWSATNRRRVAQLRSRTAKKLTIRNVDQGNTLTPTQAHQTYLMPMESILRSIDW